MFTGRAENIKEIDPDILAMATNRWAVLIESRWLIARRIRKCGLDSIA